MTKPITKNQLADFWVENFVWVNPENNLPSHCGLCGNSGLIDTCGRARTAAGVETGMRVWCICPNGDTIRRATKTKGPECK